MNTTCGAHGETTVEKISTITVAYGNSIDVTDFTCGCSDVDDVTTAEF